MFAAWFAAIVSAWAHVVLERSDPAQGATVEAPATLQLWFSGYVEPVWLEATLRRDDAPDIGLVLWVDPKDRTHLVAPIPPIENGNWTVDYGVVARDGHRVRGSFTFAVR